MIFYNLQLQLLLRQENSSWNSLFSFKKKPEKRRHGQWTANRCSQTKEKAPKYNELGKPTIRFPENNKNPDLSSRFCFKEPWPTCFFCLLSTGIIVGFSGPRLLTFSQTQHRASFKSLEGLKAISASPKAVNEHEFDSISGGGFFISNLCGTFLMNHNYYPLCNFFGFILINKINLT